MHSSTAPGCSPGRPKSLKQRDLDALYEASDFFVLGVRVPALLCLIPLVVCAKRAVPRDDELKAEYAELKPELHEALARAEESETPPDGH
jgi:hypothetical protein